MFAPGTSHEVIVEVKKSRFLAQCWPVTSRAEAEQKIHEVRGLHPQAAHVVSAFVIGKEGSLLYGMSDDGEPKGTSGRPALEVLKGSGFTNVLVTIVRYFGGTLLGTGGLVRAYGESVKEALKHTEALPIIEYTSCSIETDYAVYEAVRRKLPEIRYCDLVELFEARVKINLKIDVDQISGFCAFVEDVSRGTAEITVPSAS